MRNKEQPKHRPSMAEVAELAGVSHQTVSRVINGSTNVKDTTRQRVEQAIHTLGYRRNAAARALVTSESRLIGVIAADTEFNGPLSTLASIEKAARQQGYQTLVATVNAPYLEEVDEVLDSMLGLGVDALAVIASREDLLNHVQELDPDIPLVIVGPQTSATATQLRVSIDQAQGAEDAITHLIKQGHTRIAILTGPPDWVDAQQRFNGATACCYRNGIQLHIFNGDWTAETGFTRGVEFSRMPAETRATAVFAANDVSAYGFISALKHTGIRVPEDVCIIGFDDIPGAEYFDPSLTTVHQDFSELGHCAVQALVSQLRNSPADLPPLRPTLILRDSTGF